MTQTTHTTPAARTHDTLGRPRYYPTGAVNIGELYQRVDTVRRSDGLYASTMPDITADAARLQAALITERRPMKITRAALVNFLFVAAVVAGTIAWVIDTVAQIQG